MGWFGNLGPALRKATVGFEVCSRHLYACLLYGDSGTGSLGADRQCLGLVEPLLKFSSKSARKFIPRHAVLSQTEEGSPVSVTSSA